MNLEVILPGWCNRKRGVIEKVVFFGLMQIHPGRKKLLGVQESIGMPGVESLTVSGISHRELYCLPAVALVAGIGLTHLEWYYSPRMGSIFT